MRRDFCNIRLGVYASTLSVRLGESVIKELQKVNPDRFVELIKIKPVLKNTKEEFRLLSEALNNDVIDMAVCFLDRIYAIDNRPVKDVLADNGLSLATVLSRLSTDTVMVLKKNTMIDSKPIFATDCRERAYQIKDRFPDSKVKIIDGVNSCLNELNSGNVVGAVLPECALKLLNKENFRGFEYLNYDRHMMTPIMGQAMALLLERDGEGLENSSKRLLDGDAAYELFMEREIYDKIKDKDLDERISYITVSVKSTMDSLDVNIFLILDNKPFRIRLGGNKLEKNFIMHRILEEIDELLSGLKIR